MDGTYDKGIEELAKGYIGKPVYGPSGKIIGKIKGYSVNGASIDFDVDIEDVDELNPPPFPNRKKWEVEPVEPLPIKPFLEYQEMVGPETPTLPTHRNQLSNLTLKPPDEPVYGVPRMAPVLKAIKDMDNLTKANFQTYTNGAYPEITVESLLKAIEEFKKLETLPEQTPFESAWQEILRDLTFLPPAPGFLHKCETTQPSLDDCKPDVVIGGSGSETESKP